MTLFLKIFFYFLLILVINAVSFSQDSTRKAQDTVHKIQDTLTSKAPLFILSDYKYSYINQTNPDTLTRKRFLWYPAKNFEDIFNYLPGYYLNYMDVGQLNPVRFNQFSFNETGVFRNGRPVNDLLDGSIDYNLFSRNEIAEIEITNGFGNTLYNYKNAVNIIQRQIFQNRPVTEISFINDRYENLYFDGNFHQNLFRNFNLNFGITKHSYDGKYKNSDFDKWLGRLNLNFAVSPKLNFFAYFNYAKIQKGLNEGINPDTVNINDKEILFDPQLAAVSYEKANEIKERFDIDAGLALHLFKSSFTKLQFYQSNSFRQYNQLSNLVNPFAPLKKNNYHWINYGVKFIHTFDFKINKEIRLLTNSEADYSYIINQINQDYASPSIHYTEDDITLFQEASVVYKGLTLTGYVRGYTVDGIKNTLYMTGGAGANYSYRIDSLNKLITSVLYRNYNDYFSASAGYTNPNLQFNVSYYRFKHAELEYKNLAVYYPERLLFQGVNADINLKIFKFVLNSNYSYNFRNDYNNILPEQFGRVDLIFEDNAVKNKLEYKIGLTSRFWTKHRAIFYNAFNNSFMDKFLGHAPYNYDYSYWDIPQNATLDFYVMGKIGRATFGLTLENILNRVIYNTGVYPHIDRGGLANVISRFNITWSFFD